MHPQTFNFKNNCKDHQMSNLIYEHYVVMINNVKFTAFIFYFVYDEHLTFILRKIVLDRSTLKLS